MQQEKIKPMRRPRRQSGIALLALVALVAMMSVYYIVGSLNRTSTEVMIERNKTNVQVLQEAKAALIAYSASQAFENGSTDQPGSLPCPAADDNGAIGSCSDNTASTRVGRLPWKDIGASQLKDSSGTVLWYALSANFRKSYGTKVINSDTQGTLTVGGTSPATNVVAIIFAPGQIIPGQDRTVNSAANFLEGGNASGTDTFVTAATSQTFNDQLLTISQADLMAAVEPAVAARIERDIKPDIRAYLAKWSYLPYPSSFTAGPGNPGTNTTTSTPSTRLQSAYLGDSSLTAGRGLLPITNSSTYPLVGGGTVTPTGGTYGSFSGISCVSAGSPTGGFKCSFSIVAVDLGTSYFLSTTCRNPSSGTRYRYCIVNPAFSVSGSVGEIGLTFANKPVASDVTVKNSSGSTNRTMTGTSITVAPLQTDGSAAITYAGTHVYSNYTNTNFSRSMVVTIPISVLPFTSTADAFAGWFMSNEWYRQIYYVVSPGYLPGASGSCNVSPGTPTCLSVTGLPASSYPTSNDKAALLIMGGYSLTNSTRPSASLSAYFEGNNATALGTTNYSYVHHSGLPTTTNDRVIVLAP